MTDYKINMENKRYVIKRSGELESMFLLLLINNLKSNL